MWYCDSDVDCGLSVLSDRECEASSLFMCPLIYSIIVLCVWIVAVTLVSNLLFNVYWWGFVVIRCCWLLQYCCIRNAFIHCCDWLYSPFISMLTHFSFCYLLLTFVIIAFFNVDLFGMTFLFVCYWWRDIHSCCYSLFHFWLVFRWPVVGMCIVHLAPAMYLILFWWWYSV